MHIKFPITKEQLKRYRNLKLELANQTERLERIRARIESCSPKLSDTPKGNSIQNRLPDNICKLIELERLYKKQLKIIEDATFQIEKAIQDIDEPLEREVLRLRYIDCLGWSEVQYLIHYERSETFEIHGRALKNLYRITAD